MEGSYEYIVSRTADKGWSSRTGVVPVTNNPGTDGQTDGRIDIFSSSLCFHEGTASFGSIKMFICWQYNSCYVLYDQCTARIAIKRNLACLYYDAVSTIEMMHHGVK
jgi:hypothetical protein